MRGIPRPRLEALGLLVIDNEADRIRFESAAKADGMAGSARDDKP